MKKSIFFLYGVLSYVIFFATFLYAIGFVGNLPVPKMIDSTSGFGGAAWDLSDSANNMKYAIINILLLSVFAIQHSIMARPAFKKWWTKYIPEAIERSTYVLFASGALLLIFWQWRPMVDVIWEVQGQAGIYILTGLFWLGWVVVLLSTFMINHFHLFGLQQVFENMKDKELSDLHFSKKFFYKFIRHPIMTGFVIAFWATPVMTVGHLIFAVVTTLYVIIAVKHLEEPDLVKEIGEPYKAYQKEVPMLIPFTKFKK